jgi:CDGSH-type Zn-finger protein
MAKPAKRSEKPTIEPLANGPYLVKNLRVFTNSEGKAIETQPKMLLCRCGASNNKPFCDSSHLEISFRSDKSDDRVPDRVDDYIGKEITIHDNRGVCAHAHFCTDSSPAVFNVKKKPWVNPDAADPEETVRTIRMCPSGALSYTKDGVTHQDQDRKPAVTIFSNGPYCIVGGIALNDPTGATPESKEHYTLCRCGASRNKPFCDGKHFRARFRDDEN